MHRPSGLPVPNTLVNVELRFSRALALATLVVLAIIISSSMIALPARAGHHEDAEVGAKAKSEVKEKAGDATNTQTASQVAVGDTPEDNPRDGLKKPRQATMTAPDKFRVRFDTTEGPMTLELTREWAPNGVDRFFNLVRIGFFEEVAFFRVIKGFMAQFGMSGDPAVNRIWKTATIADDPVKQKNLRGTLTFAKTNAPHSRTTQLFLNFDDNTNLDRMGFAPIGKIVEGEDILDKIYHAGESAPRGPGPKVNRIDIFGNKYLKKDFPKLTYITKATLLE